MAVNQLPLSERIGRPLASWLCLGGGAAMLALVVLVPPWLECRRLEAQRRVLAAQLEGVESRSAAAREVEEAISRDDPVLLERLAYQDLGLKPVDALPLAVAAAPSSHDPLVLAATGDCPDPPAVPVLVEQLPRIEQRLVQPGPVVGEADLAMPAARTRLARLSRGPRRLGVIGLAGVCIALGLVTASRDREPDPA